MARRNAFYDDPYGQGGYEDEYLDEPFVEPEPAPAAAGPAPPAPAPPPPASGPGPQPNYLDDSRYPPWDRSFTPSAGLGSFTLPERPKFTPPPLPSIKSFERPAPFTFNKLRPDPFTFREFDAPDPNQVFEDPTYRFRESEGRRGLETSAAASGLLRSGGTLKDFIKYGQQFAANEYDNIYNRKRGEHEMAYGQARDQYGLQLTDYQGAYQNAADEYDRNFQQLLTAWDSNRRTAFDLFDAELRGMAPDFESEMMAYQTTAATAQRQAELEYQREEEQYRMEWDAFHRAQQEQFARDQWEWEFGLRAAEA